MWKRHLHLNEIGHYWENREINDEEKKRLHNKMILNYQGFWINKAVHLYPFYYLYKKNFFAVKSDKKFFIDLIVLTYILFASYNRVNLLIRDSLIQEVEELNFKYKSEFEELKNEFLRDKYNKIIGKKIKLQEMYEKGFLVKTLIDDKANTTTLN